jgi:hypothetical protein
MAGALDGRRPSSPAAGPAASYITGTTIAFDGGQAYLR